MMKGIYSRRGVSDLLAKDEKMDAKLAKHKADTIKFMLNTPPPATVEVTGIYTDRTHGAKGRPLAGEGVSVAKGRQSAAAATGPGAGGAKQDALISNIGDERGRIQWQDDEMKRINKAIFDAAPLPPGQPNEIPSFTGDWVCSTVSGDWDEFLYLLEVPEFQRKLAKSRKWGKGTAQQKIEMKEHKTMMSIGTCSPKLTFTVGGVQDSKPKDKKELPVMTSEIELAIDGKPQDLKFGDVQGKGTLQWEGSALIARLKVGVGGQEHSCFIKRTLRPEFIGGPAMVLEVRMQHVKALREFRLQSETNY